MLLAFAFLAQVVAVPDRVDGYIRRTLKVTNYSRADADLNRDGRLESVIYVADRHYCGSGGCLLYVLTPQRGGFRVVMRSTVSRLPIRLLPTYTGGWRDIGVTISGGGIIGSRLSRMRFDGRRYPTNPTTQPAWPRGRSSGRVLIDR